MAGLNRPGIRGIVVQAASIYLVSIDVIVMDKEITTSLRSS